MSVLRDTIVLLHACSLHALSLLALMSQPSCMSPQRFPQVTSSGPYVVCVGVCVCVCVRERERERGREGGEITSAAAA